MENVLFLVKNLFVMRIIQSMAHPADSVDFSCVSSLPEARALLEGKERPFFLTIVEAPVMDGETREMIRYFKGQGLPPLVLTNECTDAIREEMTSLGIMDYIIKDEHFAENLLQTVRRIRRNLATEVIIVDDSSVCREQARSILELQKLNVLEAGDGTEALALLDAHPGVRLILTDFKMAGMNGLELIHQVRKIRPKTQLAIIGFSDVDNPGLSARLLKNGADDFLYKTFIREELYLRVIQNIEMIGHLEELSRSSHTDYLTQLYNRRFFYEVGDKLFENVKRKNLYMTVAMLDIDHFKLVNDRYGHDAGDSAIKHVAGILTRTVRTGDIVSRYGGEEFCIIAINVNADTAPSVFERIRANIAENKIDIGDEDISITVSIGASVVMGETLEETVGRADGLMYDAKTGGRNRVVIG